MGGRVPSRWYWRGILTSLSFVLFALVLVAGARSFVVADAVRWSNVTREPMTAQAQAYAQRNGVEGNLVVRYRFGAVMLLRGILSARLFEARDVRSRWDPAHEGGYLNEPRFTWWPRAAAGIRRPLEGAGVLGWLGFGVQEISTPSTHWRSSERDVNVPLWPIALLTGAAPLMWARRAMRDWRRRRRGLCIACGYDRRGIEDRRCPECGLLPVAPVTIAG